MRLQIGKFGLAIGEETKDRKVVIGLYKEDQNGKRRGYGVYSEKEVYNLEK